MPGVERGTDDPTVEDLILADAIRSRRNWRARAAHVKPEEAERLVGPTYRIRFGIPHPGWRRLRAFCDEQGVAPPDFIRHCIGRTLAEYGWTDDEVAELDYRPNGRQWFPRTWR